MDPMTLAAIMAAVGVGKSALIDKPKEDRQRRLAAETQRYSPWTGLRADQVQEADPFGSAMQYGMTGAALGQGMESQKGNEELRKAQLAWYRSHSPGSELGDEMGADVGANAGMDYGTQAETPPPLVARDASPYTALRLGARQRPY